MAADPMMKAGIPIRNRLALRDRTVEPRWKILQKHWLVNILQRLAGCQPRNWAIELFDARDYPHIEPSCAFVIQCNSHPIRGERHIGSIDGLIPRQPHTEHSPL